MTLTRDTLVIRNIFSTRQGPLADVAGVGFRRGGLTVTSGHGDGAHSLALSEAAAVLYGLGTGPLGLAFRVTRDHRRKRAQPAAARSRW